MKTYFNTLLVFVLGLMALFVIAWRIVLPEIVPLVPPLPLALLSALLTALAAIVLVAVSSAAPRLAGKLKLLMRMKAGWMVPLLLFFFVAAPPRAVAGDYAVQKTFWSFAGTWTNSPAVVTNLAAAIDVTQVTDFALQIVAKTTNAAVGGSLDFVWETSLDGSNWPTSYTNNAANSRTTGWFSALVTNNVTTVWVTNITVDSIGYWRIRSLTNATSGNFTNMSIVGYIKPKRTNRDY